MPFENLSILKALWEFLSPLLSDEVKEHIKDRRKSEDIAIKQAIELYKLLEEITELNAQLHLPIHILLNQTKKAVSKVISGDTDREHKIVNILNKYYNHPAAPPAGIFRWRLLSALEKLGTTLDSMSLQLKIFDPDSFSKLQSYFNRQGDKPDNLYELLQELSSCDSPENFSAYKEKIEKIYTELEETNKIIRGAIESFRVFLAKEFSFGEGDKERYAKAVTDTYLWFDKARELLALAEKIEQGMRNDLASKLNELNSILDNEDFKKPLEEEEKIEQWPFQFQGVYLSLIAFGIENLCKADIIRKHREKMAAEILKTGRLPDKITTHNLIQLVKEEVGVSLDQQEETLLRNLEKAAVWAGRYPVPIKAYGEISIEDYDKFIYTKALAPGKYFFDHINAIVDKISEYIGENLVSSTQSTS